MAAIGRRDGVVYGGVTLDIPAEVTHHLAEHGYDPRYGARPLKRAIERHLLAPLAAGLNAYSGELARSGNVRLEQGKLKDEVRARLDRAGRAIAGRAITAALPVASIQAATTEARSATSLRRSMQALERSADALRLRNEVARLTMSEERWLREQRDGRFTPPPHTARLSRLRRLLGELDDLAARVVALEDETLMELYRGLDPASNVERANGNASPLGCRARLGFRKMPSSQRLTIFEIFRRTRLAVATTYRWRTRQNRRGDRVCGLSLRHTMPLAWAGFTSFAPTYGARHSRPDRACLGRAHD